MVSTLLLWTYMAALSFIYGEGCFVLLARRTQNGRHAPVPGPIKWMVGFAILSAIAAALNLFVEIGLLANLAVSLGGLLLLMAFRDVYLRALRRSLAVARKLHAAVRLLGLAIVLVVLIKAAERPRNYDTGLYHAQAIRWIEEHPTLPGLGNLHDPFGYNSAWFPPAALFSFSFLSPGPFRPTGSFLFLLAAAYGLSRLDALLRGKISLENVGAVFSVFLLRRLLSWELSSPGTDLPAAILIWTVFLLSSGKIDRQERHFSPHTSAILILSAFAFMVKINTAVVLLLPIYFVLREWNTLPRGTALTHALLLGALILPWIAGNRLLSGYLVYPVAALDIFDVDWKIPREVALRRVDLLRSWVRIPGADADQVLGMPLSEWAPIWYAGQEPLLHQVLLGIAGGVALLGALVVLRYAVKKKKPQNLQRYAILYVTAATGVLFWFLQAPAFRLGYGYLGAALIMLYAPPLVVLLQDWRFLRRPIIGLLALILLLYQGVSLYNARDIAALQARWIYPANYPKAVTEVRELGNFTVNMPVRGDQCWYAPLPCTPIHNPEVNLRESGFEDGFFVKND